MHHDRRKHVEVYLHFIKEKIEGVIKITHVPTAEQTADLSTKGLFRQAYEKFLDKLECTICIAELEGEYWRVFRNFLSEIYHNIC